MGESSQATLVISQGAIARLSRGLQVPEPRRARQSARVPLVASRGTQLPPPPVVVPISQPADLGEDEKIGNDQVSQTTVLLPVKKPEAGPLTPPEGCTIP
jgi:hypothetical protein